jgi:GAF domain-containing protein
VTGPSDHGGSLEDLTRFVVSEAPLEQLMERIALAAAEVIEPVAAASITFAKPQGRAWTVASTGALATDLDEAQYALGHGPCVDAATGGTAVLIRDMRAEDRWPGYTPVAVDAGVRSSLSMPLPIQEHVLAALNLYSCEVDAFTEADRAAAVEVATTAAAAVANAVLYESASQLAADLQDAMRSRATIEQAKGIVMAQSAVGPDEAFDLLVRASQRENRKLRELAAEIVERHSRPRS